MIPTSIEDVDLLVAEAERQSAGVRDLFSRFSEAELRWRPDEGRWSVLGHLEHVAIVNHGYLRPIADAVRRGRSVASLRGSGPYRHPWVTRFFVRSMEPPPRQRLRTFKVMQPQPEGDASEVLADVAESLERLGGELEAARGLDLGRVRFRSPYLWLLRLSLGGGFEALLAHGRRHLWLIDELTGSDRFGGERAPD